jgi:hypothetical protein
MPTDFFYRFWSRRLYRQEVLLHQMGIMLKIDGNNDISPQGAR